MRFLTTSEHYYEIHYGHGNGYDAKGPLYSAQEAHDVSALLMTEQLSNPMRKRTWVRVLQDGVLYREFRRIEAEVWKEFPVNNGQTT